MADAQPSQVDKWLSVISTYDNEFKKWEARVNKILKRYRDDNRSPTGNNEAKFNILWSNVQTLIPAVYARMPKADVSRRFSDNDPIGRVAALLIERTLDYEIEHFSDFRSTMRYAVEDRFLGGRGVAWVRYDPHVVKQDVPEDGDEITEDIENPEGELQNDTAGTEGQPEQIDYECAPTDYVHWKDFGHSSARTWEEVTQGWRWVYMTKDALTERFGEDIAKKIPLDSGPNPLNKQPQTDKEGDRAKICELWDKESGQVFWFSKSYPQIIDIKDDPLKLEGFFPFAKPLYATTTTDSLVPVPDYVLYQDQANELDILSDRIDGLVKALRVRGVYDASISELQRLLTEGDNNTLIGVQSWTRLTEKGGLEGVVDLLPIDMIAKALLAAYEARDNIKEQIYEITGISDILRGQTSASETATAQQIKGQYASLRLKSMQESVALFASELLRLKAQIICTKYQPATILAYAAADQLSDADKQLIPQAMQLIAKNPLRPFRIEVDADSLVQIDETQNKQDRIEFIKAFGQFAQQAVEAGMQVPEMAPPLMEMMKFAVAGFKQARAIEGTIDTALEQLKQKAAQASANPKPDPEMAKVMAQQQSDQARLQADTQAKAAETQANMQMEQFKAQNNAQIEEMKARYQAQSDERKLQYEAQLETQRMQLEQKFETWKAELDASTKIMVARISANPGVDTPDMEATSTANQKLVEDLGGKVSDLAETIKQSHQNTADAHAATQQHLANLTKAISAPKRIVRGADGRATGVEPMAMN